MVTMLLKMVATLHCVKRGLSQTQNTLSPFRKVPQTRKCHDTHRVSVNSLGAASHLCTASIRAELILIHSLYFHKVPPSHPLSSWGLGSRVPPP